MATMPGNIVDPERIKEQFYYKLEKEQRSAHTLTSGF